MVAVQTLPRGTPSLVMAIAIVLSTAFGFLLVRPVATGAQAVLVSAGGRGTISGVAQPAEAPNGSRPETVYRVRDGDTVWDIARLHGTTVAAVTTTNRLRHPFQLHPGQRLRVSVEHRNSPPPVGVARSPVRDAVNAAAKRWGSTHGVPAALLKAVAWHESRWKPDAVSSKGAVGVAQVVPSTGEWVERRLIGHDADLRDVDSNMRVAAAYLRWLIDRSEGDVAAALAAYYQGPTSTLTDGWFSSTERYVRDVFVLWARFT